MAERWARGLGKLRRETIVSRLRIDLSLEDLIIGVTPEGLLQPSETLNFTYCTPYLEARAIQRVRHG